MRELRALTREVGRSLADCQLTHLERAPIDVDLARRQHAAYVEALLQSGVTVDVLPASDEFPDSVFVEDTAVVLDEVAILAHPGAPSRRGEVAAIAAALAPFRRLERIEPPGTLDGGDVLVAEDRIYVGISTRTNGEGCMQLARIAGRFGYRVMPVEVAGCLHLKSAATVLDDCTLLVNPSWIVSRDLLREFRCIDVAPDEPWAANALAVNHVVHVSARSPRTRGRIDAFDYRTLALDIGELEKAEGALTCSSLIFAVP